MYFISHWITSVSSDPSSEEWEKYNRELSETKKRIADLRQQAPDFHNELKLEDMTIKQLKERIHALQSALDTCKPNTGEFREYSQALQETENQLRDVTSRVQESLDKFNGGGFLRKVIGAEADFKSIKSFLTGNLIFKGVTMAFDTVNLRFNVKPDYDQQQLQHPLLAQDDVASRRDAEAESGAALVV